MIRPAHRVTGWAVLAAVAITAISGCVTDAEPPAQVLSLPDDPDGGGLPGPWLSPVLAPCTGAAALAASGWISNNPAAGG